MTDELRQTELRGRPMDAFVLSNPADDPTVVAAGKVQRAMNSEPSGEEPAIWEQTIPNRLADLMQAIEEMLAFLDAHQIDSRARYTAQLAVEEMGTNVIKYGYDDAGDHQIELRVTCTPDSFLIELTDDGHEWNPCEAPEPDTTLGLDGREPGGLGICLVRRMLSRMDYERQNDRNVLTMVVGRERDG